MEFIEEKVLDKGYVRLINYMGNDRSICEAARISYGKDQKERTIEQDTSLIRYLFRNEHTSPFEMVEFLFGVKLPIFVARQWIRHRTASVNEMSGRYSVLKNEFYVPQPEQIRSQGKMNKQGSDIPFDIDQATKIIHDFEVEQFHDAASYSGRIQAGVSKEMARINLPVSTYTEWYWKIDLKNLLHFLKLRLDSHAQWEIQQYGIAISEIIKQIVPITWKAFEDYVLNSVKLSKLEQITLLEYITENGKGGFQILLNNIEKVLNKETLITHNPLNSYYNLEGWNTVELNEFKEKIKKLINK